MNKYIHAMRVNSYKNFLTFYKCQKTNQGANKEKKDMEKNIKLLCYPLF